MKKGTMSELRKLTDDEKAVIDSSTKAQVRFIMEIVCGYYKQPYSKYSQKGSGGVFLKARDIAIYFITQVYKIEISQAKLVSFFNFKTHSSIIHARNKIKGYLGWDRLIQQEVKELKALIEHKAMVIEGKFDLREDYDYINLNECLATKREGRAIVFSGFTPDEVNGILARLNVQDKTLIEFSKTGMYLLKKKENNEALNN